MAETAQLARTGSGSETALDRAGALAGNARAWFSAMHPARRRQLGVAVLLTSAIIAAMVWYAGRTDWRVLYSGLESKDMQQVAQELSAAGVAYQMTADGSGIEVGADQIDRARMEIASRGMPQTGRMGFELFDKPNWVGSEFDEKVNYQRALEGELEHTIGTLAVVRSARVHLVLPKDSEFGEAAQQAKASVVLQLRRTSMPPEQIQAIRGLVASAVENLNPGNVTLVDAEGRLNFAAPTNGEASSDEARALGDKLVAMLEPMTGAGNVRATVNVSYDEGSLEKTDEVYDPAQVATLTMHRSEQTAGGAKPHAAGVPGTASNTPGPVVPASVPAAAKASAAVVPPLLQTTATAAQPAGAANAALPVYPQSSQPADGESITDENGTYAVSRHLSHSEEGPGRVRRVTAAIVVNDRMTTEGAGKQLHDVWKPRSADEMQRLQQLARAAVGFEATRGDEVVVENIGFSSNTPEPVPTALAKATDTAEGLLHAQPGLVKTLCFSLVALLIVFVVLKPISRQVTATLSQTPALALPSGGPADARRTAFGVGADSAYSGLSSGAPQDDPQAVFRHISEQIRKEPVQSARLLESWINTGAEEAN